MMKLDVGVVGLGIGREHVRRYQALNDKFRVATICDADAQRLDRVGDRLGVDSRTSDFDALLASGVDIVDICTPPHLHFDMAQRALEAGCHVVCEKPLVNSLYEVDELIRIQRDSGKRLMPISQYRFGAGVQKLRHLVAEGLTGEPYVGTIETHWNRGADYYAAEWRGRWDTERGGVLLGHALHNHDLMCFILGDVKRAFAAATTRVNPIETEDCASVSFEMANGALVTSSATLGSRHQISRLRFCFEHLTAESALEPYDPGADPWLFVASNASRQAKIDAALAAFDPPSPGFAGQFEGLWSALVEGAPLPVTLADSRRALELVTAMYASARAGAPVDLPLGEQAPGYRDWRPVRPSS